ncbi:MAG: DUF975 family protein [Clostridiales Family XIII bacterium]|jgi:uncharacterized membrane protein|nr:DUF975 family protein [Clostridiales Family XIII bacterium]
MWKIRTVKKTGRRMMRGNYLVCFVACLILTFVVSGPMSISDRITDSENVLKGIAVYAPGSRTADIIDDAIDGIEKFKKSTSLGSDAKSGAIGNAYHQIANAGGVTGLITNSVNTIFAKGKLGSVALQLFTFMLAAFLFLFVNGVLEFGLARLFLENRRSRATRVNRIFFIYQVGRTRRVALIVFMRTLYLFLWALTIVGFPVKYYAYRQIPYLAAENPDLTHREIFKLSASLMKGQKFRLFLFDMSFIPWWLLSVITFGIMKYVWLDPFYYASRAEVYAQLRGEALTLEAPASARVHEKLQGLISHVGAKPRYSFVNLALLFLFFSFVGWVFECTLWIVTEGLLVNRGTMYGPWIPIYGAGGIIILLLVNRFSEKPLVCFFMIIAVCAPVEYLGAWFLWETRHLKYWDYSGYFLNIQGRICLESMLNFAVMGLLGIYVLAPVADSLLNKIPLQTRKGICAALYALFVADLALSEIFPRSGRGITNKLQ